MTMPTIISAMVDTTVSFDATELPWLQQFAQTANPAIYRFTAYCMLTMLDDPAMLALAFC
jgi:hypothetical protein